MGQLLSLISGSENAEKVFIDFESMFACLIVVLERICFYIILLTSYCNETFVI